MIPGWSMRNTVAYGNLELMNIQILSSYDIIPIIR